MEIRKEFKDVRRREKIYFAPRYIFYVNGENELEYSTVIVLAVKWLGVVRWTREWHKDQGRGAFVHAITAFVGATTLTSAVHPLAPTAVHPFGIIVRARPSFPGSEIYITIHYSSATSCNTYVYIHKRCAAHFSIATYYYSNLRPIYYVI